MAEIAKLLIVTGALLLTAGLILFFLPKPPFLGKLPGDIIIKREHFTFSFPLATSIILSIVISLALWFLNRFRQ